MAKDFSSISTGSIYNAISKATQETSDTQETQKKSDTSKTHKTRKARKTYTADEKREIIATFETRGRKGIKLPRINVALKPELLVYLKKISAASGLSMTQYINLVLEIDRKQNKKILDKVDEVNEFLVSDIDLEEEEM